jgi:hypothetical protein
MMKIWSAAAERSADAALAPRGAAIALAALFTAATPSLAQEGLPAVIPDGPGGTPTETAAADLEYTGNLFENAGFESGTNHWALSQRFAPAGMEVVSDGSAGHALHVRNRGEWSVFYHDLPLAQGEKIYTVTFRARAGEPSADTEGNPVEPAAYLTTYTYGNKDGPGPVTYLHDMVRMRPKPLGPEWREYEVRFWTEKVWYYDHFVLALGVRGDVLIDDVDCRMLLTEVPQVAERVMRSRHASERLEASHVNKIEALLETPHLRLGRPSAAGPIKTLFFVAIQASCGTRDVVEMAQRFDIDFSNYTLWHPTTFAWTDINQYGAFEGVSLAEKTADALEKLAADNDVTVLGNVAFSSLPITVRSRILTRVRDGMGLVVVSPHDLPEEYQQVEAAGAREEILTGVPLAGLPEFFPGTDLSLQERAAHGVNGYEVGKGRIAVIRWSLDKPPDGGGVAPAPAMKPWTGKELIYDYLSPHRPLHPARWTRQYEHRYNYHLSLAAKAIQWAAKKSPRATWSRLPEDGIRIPHVALPDDGHSIEVTWAGESDQTATLSAAIRDPLGHVQWSSKQALTLAPGANEIPLSLPRLSHGLQYLDLGLSTGHGVENWATVSMFVEGPEEIVSLITDSEYCERGENARGTASFSKAIPARARLDVSARDTNGRVYNRISMDVPAGATDAVFDLALDRPTTIATYLEAELVRGGEVLSFADAIVFVPKRDFRGFLSVLWCNVWNEGIGQVALRQARKAGFNAVYHWANSVGDFENGAMADMMPTIYATHIALRPDERGWVTGIPGNGRLDPVFRDWVDNTFINECKAAMPLAPPYYSLGDENHFQHGFGFSPYGMKAYRQFLERRYGTIGRLNETYGATYKNFEVVPRLRDAEAMAQGSIPALIDHRLGTDDDWAGYHHDLAREVRKHDPDARVGAEGSLPGNLERMLEGVQFWAPYSAGKGKNALKRSLISRDVPTSHWWGGVGSGARDAAVLWTWLMRGLANFNQWFCTQHVDGAMLNPDYSFRPFMENLLPDIREIMAGPGLLLRDARVVSDREIVLHFSRESEHAALALNDLANRQDAEKCVLQNLNMLGRDYRYVSSRQITEGKLITPRAKILFLPSTHTLSGEAAGGIREFVEAGGWVVADFLPALDEFGRRLPEGRLDSLFGVTRAGEPSPIEIDDPGIDTEINGRRLHFNCGQTIADASVKAADAEPMARHGEVPLLLINRHGAGRTLLLNIDLSRCADADGPGFIDALLRAAGAEPEYRLDGPATSEFSVMQRGDMTLLGVVLPALDPLDPRQEAIVSWDEHMHVYDVRAGKYLGHLNRIEIEVQGTPRREHLFTLQPIPLTGVELQCSGETARGESLALLVELQFEGAPAAIDRPVRIDVRDPDGEPVMHYRDFLTLTEARGEALIPFAYNDKPGPWTLTVTDIATGVSATRTILVRE